MDVGYERKTWFKDDTTILSLSHWVDGVPSIEKMRRYEEGNRLGTSSHSFHSVNDVSEIQKTILVSVVLGTQGKYLGSTKGSWVT